MQQYYQRWQSLSQRPEARHWTPQGFLPHYLSSDEHALAQHEIESLPEQFYTTFDWLLVISPELYTHFEAAASTEIPSGSAHISFDQKYTYIYGDNWIIE